MRLLFPTNQAKSFLILIHNGKYPHSGKKKDHKIHFMRTFKLSNEVLLVDENNNFLLLNHNATLLSLK